MAMSAYVKERLAEIEAKQKEEADQNELLAALLRERSMTPEEKQLREVKRAEQGYVYFIKAGNMVKIGFSTDVVSRLDGLSTGNHRKLKLLSAMPATKHTETFMHKTFAAQRDHGEWFRIEGELAIFLKVLPSHLTIAEKREPERPIIPL